jgi:hypothetical protein
LTYQATIFKQNLGLNEHVYALDATFIDIVMNMVDWNRFRATKGAIKLHTVYSVTQQLPVLVNITAGKTHDLEGMPHLDSRFSDSIVTFDKGYWRACWLYSLPARSVKFVTGIKSNVNYQVNGQHPVALGTGVLKDEVIEFTSSQLKQAYPEELRLVTYLDTKLNRTYQFVTNLTDSTKYPAKQVADIYRYRWQIELFFKWVKQHLRVKTFYGTSQNAVFNQIWVALIYYLLISHIHSQASYPYSKLELTRVINISLLQRIPLIDLMRANFKSTKEYIHEMTDQLALFPP